MLFSIFFLLLNIDQSTPEQTQAHLFLVDETVFYTVYHADARNVSLRII